LSLIVVFNNCNEVKIKNNLCFLRNIFEVTSSTLTEGPLHLFNRLIMEDPGAEASLEADHDQEAEVGQDLDQEVEAHQGKMYKALFYCKVLLNMPPFTDLGAEAAAAADQVGAEATPGLLFVVVPSFLAALYHQDQNASMCLASSVHRSRRTMKQIKWPI